MAINKTINKSTKTKAAMRNCIEYVLQEHKIPDGLVYMTGPAPDDLTWDKVYQSFLEEKKLWNKNDGRMYNHNIISFHKDERIMPKEALEFGREFAERWFPGHQTLIAVHQDKEHLHLHLVTNTVSYMTGAKLHNSKADLEKMKNLTNAMCLERGLTIEKKGYHFDGKPMEEGEIIAWSKDKYHLLIDDQKKSYIVDCAIAVIKSKENCTNKDYFIKSMKEKGWHTIWQDNRKHITFINDNGEKVRDTNLTKSFSMDISKEGLLREFEKQNTHIRADRERERATKKIEQYSSEIQSATSGLNTAKTIRYAQAAVFRNTRTNQITSMYADSNETNRRRTGTFEETWKTAGCRTDTDSFIRCLDSQEQTSRKNRDHRIAQRQDRDAEQRRLSAERELPLKAVQQGVTKEGSNCQRRSRSHGIRH